MKHNNHKYKAMINRRQSMTISPPTIIKMDDSKYNQTVKCDNNHSSKTKSNSKLFAVSTTALFIIPSSYSILPISTAILSSIPIIASLLVYTSTYTQIHKIHKIKSTMDYSPIPFIYLLNNSMIWEMYGILSSNPTIIMTHAIAISSASVGMAVFAKNNTNSINKSVMKRHCTFSSLILLSLATSYTLRNEYDILSILGLIGCGTNVISYASPLCVIKNVIKNKSTSALPFGLSSTLTLNAATWFCYGWYITDDLYVWIPCLLGFGAGLVQLSLFAIY